MPWLGNSLNLCSILCIGAVVRLILIAYGEWHDYKFDLKYTDIDYTVFSDAALHVSEVRHATTITNLIIIVMMDIIVSSGT